MGKAKRLITSALVISGATALSPMDVGATELEPNLFDEDLQAMIEQEMLEKALRSYTNPLHRIEAEMNQDHDQETTYIVQEGDTLSEIAQKFGVEIKEIVHQNEIQNVNRIAVNQELKIRVVQKNYVIKFGDNAQQIADEHGITVEELVSTNGTLKYTSAQLYPGTEIQVPTPTPDFPEEQLEDNQPEKANTILLASRSDVSASTQTISGFQWPVTGTVTSRFGMRWGRQHNGIDIANSLKKEAVIAAAKAGVVKEAGFHSGGYGNLVILDHGQGVETYYAHMSKISVKANQEIKQGEQIGYMGQTGRTTGYHLHFEIRINDKPVNPSSYLE
ncbi:M23 family metallopeptidase [Bacillus horti]|uniref:Murein DD-endopeptidase MepM/ murein hydrolase activator NlpD n=1 Tax=Caldalkalibacillus horti TaxID=77523 RepID=A0ABT9VVZ4_9BACI|nr:M23 family metallopeptidase [Bacillus horti]MDQ0165134.1 murein DD-endopeptidase MepM/ murein hydrolase activator NlpD [Bacillus horti]